MSLKIVTGLMYTYRNHKRRVKSRIKKLQMTVNR